MGYSSFIKIWIPFFFSWILHATVSVSSVSIKPFPMVAASVSRGVGTLTCTARSQSFHPSHLGAGTFPKPQWPCSPLTSTIGLKSNILTVSGESSCSRMSLPRGRHCLGQLCQVLWGSWRLTLRHWIRLHISRGANVMSNKPQWHLLGNRCCPNGGLLHTKALSMWQCLFLSIIHTATWGHSAGVRHQSLGKRGHQQPQLEESLLEFPAVAALSPLAADCRRCLQPKERNWGKKK